MERLLKCIAAIIFSVLLCNMVAAAEKTTLCVAIRSLANPYQSNFKVGGEILAKRIGLDLVVLTCEGSSEKQVNDIKSLVARTRGNVVFMIDPNEATDMLPIALALEEANVYYSTWFNKPEDVNAWEFPHWVSHIAYDGVAIGKFTAGELISTFKTPGKGKIIALQGMLANSIAQDRFNGLLEKLKETPDVKLVAYESAEWDRTKAYEKTKNMLIANPDIDGVWCANDDMALGALEALRERGLAGKVLVTGCDGVSEVFAAIKKGEIACTVFQDSKYQAGLSLSQTLAAKSGKLDVEALPHEKRQFFISATQVTRNNIDEFMHKYVDNTPDYDFDDYFAEWTRPME